MQNIKRRPKGNGPHMVIFKLGNKRKINCKYFDNFKCNANGGKCNPIWAVNYCKYYRSENKIEDEIEIKPVKDKASKQLKKMKKNLGMFFKHKKYGIGKVLAVINCFYFVEFPDYDGGIKGRLRYRSSYVFYKSKKELISEIKNNKS